MGSRPSSRGLRRRPRRPPSSPTASDRLSREVPGAVRDSLRRIGGLRTVRRSAPSRRRAAGVARTLRAVSDPSRLRILGALARASLCPCLIRRIEPMKNSVLSYHLRILKGAGLVRNSATSHFRIYEVTERGREIAALLRRVEGPVALGDGVRSVGNGERAGRHPETESEAAREDRGTLSRGRARREARGPAAPLPSYPSAPARTVRPVPTNRRRGSE